MQSRTVTPAPPIPVSCRKPGAPPLGFADLVRSHRKQMCDQDVTWEWVLMGTGEGRERPVESTGHVSTQGLLGQLQVCPQGVVLLARCGTLVGCPQAPTCHGEERFSRPTGSPPGWAEGPLGTLGGQEATEHRELGRKAGERAPSPPSALPGYQHLGTAEPDVL